ncbi:hypothetical protein PN36_25085 [Candidatus Thiomargarita nelsonii]|uniref:SpoVT-AbrB domain-containing protein n=1 Tax=Candidatus Thiomargarita nelsonii TaxID=1003181 RepID=A0A0A6PRA8_9GAMM|nr:hypothetical protein PN36_25085 [Candidatus Thiomargarita nelsonii]
MITQTCQIDSQGRITLPKDAFDLMGFLPNMNVMLELTKASIVIKQKRNLPPITAEIAQMELPVADWEQMAQEVEEGRLKLKIRQSFLWM